MRKIGSPGLVLAIVLAFCLAGCGGDAESTAESAAESATETATETATGAADAATEAAEEVAENAMLTCAGCGMEMKASEMVMVEGKPYCPHCAPEQSQESGGGGS